MGFPGGSDGKEFACNAEDLGSIPGLRTSPGGGHGNPLQYSCPDYPHGQSSLVGYSPWGRKESDTPYSLLVVFLFREFISASNEWSGINFLTLSIHLLGFKATPLWPGQNQLLWWCALWSEIALLLRTSVSLTGKWTCSGNLTGLLQVKSQNQVGVLQSRA